MDRLTVASYNLHSCVGMDRRRSAARIAQVLRELDCDIFALQEVDNQPGEHAESMQLEFLSNALSMAAVPGLRLVRKTGEYGNAVLSRLPIESIRRHDLSYSGFHCEPRGAIDIEVGVRGERLRLIAAHLGLRRSERQFQWHKIIDIVQHAPREMPVVVLGDMNEWYPRSVMLKEAHRLFGEPPAPPAFPSFAPFLRLTRIWVRPSDAVVSIEPHRTDLSRLASDHLPLKAVLDVQKLFGLRAQREFRLAQSG